MIIACMQGVRTALHAAMQRACRVCGRGAGGPRTFSVKNLSPS
jgi:hypothetical protein